MESPINNLTRKVAFVLGLEPAPETPNQTAAPASEHAKED